MQESTPERNIQGSTFYTRPYLVCLTRRSNFYSHCNPAKIHDAPAALDERSRTRTRCPDDHTAFFFSTAHSSSSSSSASTDQLECARPRGPIKRRFGLRPAQEQHLVRMRVNTHTEKAPRPSLSFSFPHSLHAPFRVYIYIRVHTHAHVRRATTICLICFDRKTVTRGWVFRARSFLCFGQPHYYRQHRRQASPERSYIHCEATAGRVFLFPPAAFASFCARLPRGPLRAHRARARHRASLFTRALLTSLWSKKE